MAHATTVSVAPLVPFRHYMWPEEGMPRVIELNGRTYEMREDRPRGARKLPASLLSSTDVGILLDADAQARTPAYKRPLSHVRYLPFTFALAAQNAGMV